MTIGFTTEWPKSMGPKYAGKPTHFVEKIWTGLIHELNHINISDYEKYYTAYRERFGLDLSLYDQVMISPKVTTFREDPKDRWKVGMKIHPVINNRSKSRFQFAPELEVKGIQKVEIKHSKSNPGIVWIIIDGFNFYEGPTYNVYNRRLTELAINDGFEDVEQFFAWFNKDFTGKIIHWTNLKY